MSCSKAEHVIIRSVPLYCRVYLTYRKMLKNALAALQISLLLWLYFMLLTNIISLDIEAVRSVEATIKCSITYYINFHSLSCLLSSITYIGLKYIVWKASKSDLATKKEEPTASPRSHTL